MSAHLIYRPRDGIVSGTVGQTSFQSATLRNPASLHIESWRQPVMPTASNVWDWQKVQELRSGGGTNTPAHRLTVAQNAPLEIFDYPGAYAQRFDGVDRGGSRHRHHGRVIWINAGTTAPSHATALCLHGPPPCGNRGCIVLVQDWDALYHALKTARRITLIVEM